MRFKPRQETQAILKKKELLAAHIQRMASKLE
jgi:hypothetical protein